VKDYLNLPLAHLLEDTAAKTPTPGGGSVAAFVGALGAALGRMAVNYTVGKPAYAQHEPRLRSMLEELQRCGQMFTQLAGEDMAAYERYSASRKGGDTDEQQRALLTAATVPLEMVAVASAVLQRLDEIKHLLNPYLLSDLQAAAILTDAAASAAALNVTANTTQLANRPDAEQLASQLQVLLQHCSERKQSVTAYRTSA
jgi:formiminotetrahydrofolate cyclodeaminase